MLGQALSASTTPEKDRIIEDLRHVWRVRNSCAQQLTQCNSQMRSFLFKLREKERRSLDVFNTLCTNTGFLEFFDGHFLSKFKGTDVAPLIQSIEADISRFSSLSRPSLLSRILSSAKPPFFIRLKLRDLLFRRLEELTCTLKKRSFVLDESDDSSLAISREFGSLGGLLAAYHRLVDENERLKSEESTLRGDAFVKRRNLAEIAVPSVCDLIVILQRGIVVEKGIGESLPVTPAPKQVAAADWSFGADETISPTDSMVVSSDSIAEQERIIEHLTEELNQMRAHPAALFHESQGEQRHWQNQEQHGQQIHCLQERISATVDASRVVTGQVADRLQETFSLGLRYSSILKSYQALMDDHLRINAIWSHNDQIVDAFTHCSCAMGDWTLHHQFEFAEFFKSKRYLTITAEVPFPIPTSAPPEEEDTSERLLHRYVRRRTARRKKPHVPRSDSASSLARHDVHPTSNIELFDLLALTCDVAAQADPHFRSCVVTASQTMLRRLAADIGLCLRECTSEMRSAIGRVRMASDAILTFPKSDAATEVDTEPRADAETQTPLEFNAKVAAPSQPKKGAALRKKLR
jgi:hypothetical protein